MVEGKSVVMKVSKTRVGGGEMLPDEMPQILGRKDRTAAGPTAPAHGLTMMGIEYGE